MELWLRAAREPALRETAALVYAQLHASFRALLDEGVAAGEFAVADPDGAADRLVAAVDGFGLRTLLTDPGMPPERALEQVWGRVQAELGGRGRMSAVPEHWDHWIGGAPVCARGRPDARVAQPGGRPRRRARRARRRRRRRGGDRVRRAGPAGLGGDRARRALARPAGRRGRAPRAPRPAGRPRARRDGQAAVRWRRATSTALPTTSASTRQPPARSGARRSTSATGRTCSPAASPTASSGSSRRGTTRPTRGRAAPRRRSPWATRS